MDNKVIAAIVAVAILVVAGAAAVVLMGDKDESNNTYSMIGRVNTEGSGIYLKDGESVSTYLEIVSTKPADHYLGEDGKYVHFFVSGWGGKVFGTPGAATIQHVQLQDIVLNVLGLKFQPYLDGAALNSDTVYYMTGIASYANFAEKKDANHLTGAIIWEAQYSVAMQKGCVGLVTTNDMFPGHTCCIIGASSSYIKDNEATTKAFLAAYVETVKRLQAALTAGSGADYDKAIEVAMEKVAMPSGTTDAEKQTIILSALNYVTYAYADGADGNLNKLTTDVADLFDSMVSLKNIKKTASDLGYDNSAKLAENFVQDKYMKGAIADNTKLSEKVNITVAVIGGDIHQLAIHYGIALGIFDAHGIGIELSTQTNGPGIYTALANGTAQFGFLGAPPMTINCANAGQI